MPIPRRRPLDDDDEGLVEFVELDGVLVIGLEVCSEKDCVQHEVSVPQQ